jgi:ADP-heptose:LPS heptosyltransferase
LLLETYLEKLNVKIRQFSAKPSIQFCSRNLVTILPGSGSQGYKRWPFERFLEVIEDIYKNSDYDIAVVAGSDEYDSSVIPNKLSGSARFHNVGDGLDFFQIIGLLSLSNFVIGNDNGLLHLAEAIKVPTIGLYTTNWEYLSRKYLYNDAEHIVLPELEKDPIAEHLKTSFFKPKNFRNQCNDTILSISVQEVLEKARRFLC